jgi:uncharacterized protein
MRGRSIAWTKDGAAGAEFVEVTFDDRALSAVGVAIGGDPLRYRADYELETGPEFVTARLQVTVAGEGWSRTLDLRRDPSGTWWDTESSASGAPPVPLPPPAGDLGEVVGALDCDLALSPLTNSMPVLRHGLHQGAGSAEFLMAWVSLPDLGVHAARQRYTAVRDLADDRRLIRFESLDDPFTADLTFDRDGLVIDYPEIGHLLG